MTILEKRASKFNLTPQELLSQMSEMNSDADIARQFSVHRHAVARWRERFKVKRNPEAAKWKRRLQQKEIKHERKMDASE